MKYVSYTPSLPQDMTANDATSDKAVSTNVI